MSGSGLWNPLCALWEGASSVGISPIRCVHGRLPAEPGTRTPKAQGNCPWCWGSGADFLTWNSGLQGEREEVLRDGAKGQPPPAVREGDSVGFIMGPRDVRMATGVW